MSFTDFLQSLMHVSCLFPSQDWLILHNGLQETLKRRVVKYTVNQSRALNNAGEIEGLMHNPSMFLMLSSRHEKGQHIIHIIDAPEQLTPEWPDPTWNRLCVDIDTY